MNASKNTLFTLSPALQVIETFESRSQKKVRARRMIAVGAAALVAASLISCSSAPAVEGSAESLGDVTLVVHDSFPNAEFEKAASEATGYNVTVVSAGDGGELTNKLVLTQGAPIADAFFGVDNVFASRIIDSGAAEAYQSENLPDSANAYLADTEGLLSPVTRGATCINIDPQWFVEEGMTAPSSYADLAQPEYAELTVLLDPSSSSTGASFLVGTVAEFGEEGFEDYWSALKNGGARIEQGWSDAYNGQFTQGGGEGTYPIVLSYSSSPAWAVNEEGTESSTVALLETCSSQVEYAGVLAGAAHPEGAQAVVDYLLSPEFQDTIADTMYVYPVIEDAHVSDVWKQFAALPENPRDLTPAEIGAGREAWLRGWSASTGW